MGIVCKVIIYHSTKTRHWHMLWCCFSSSWGSVGVLSWTCHVRSWMNEDERFSRSNASTSSIMLFSKLCKIFSPMNRARTASLPEKYNALHQNRERKCFDLFSNKIPLKTLVSVAIFYSSWNEWHCLHHPSDSFKHSVKDSDRKSVV